MNKIEKHAEICQELTDMYEKKNADYGDSFSELRKEFPNSITLRLTDKLNRLKTLYNPKYEQKVSDESIDDTLKDIANYAILELIERGYEIKNKDETENKNNEEPNTLIIDKRSANGILTCKYIDEDFKTIQFSYQLVLHDYSNAVFELATNIYKFLQYICSETYILNDYTDNDLGQSALGAAFEMMEEDINYARFEASSLAFLIML